MTRPPDPLPAGIRRLLATLLRGPGAEHLLGDLDEEYQRRATTLGPRHAARWVRRQAVLTVFWWWHPASVRARRIRSGRRAVPARALAAVAFAGIAVTLAAPERGVRRNGAPLVFIHTIDRAGDRYQRFTFPEAEALAGTPGVSRLAAYSTAQRILHAGDIAHPVRVARVSGDFFEALDAAPRHGRLLTARDVHREAPVAVMSWEFWIASLGGDSAVLGTTVTLEGPFTTPMTIVGITPPGFAVPDDADIWIPASRWLRQDTDREVSVLARLTDDVTLPDASARITAAVARMPSARRGPAGVRGAWVEQAAVRRGSHAL